MVKLVKIHLYIFVIFQFVDGFTYQNARREIEICGTTNGHRKYLELGDLGEIIAENISVPKVNLKKIIYIMIYVTMITPHRYIYFM